MDYKTTEQDTSCLPEPLTHTNADGEIYQRQAVVDRQIQEAFRLDPEELRRRSEVTDKVSPDFLKEESLVYLIRHYHKAGNRRVVDALSESLLRRCATLINSKLSSLRVDLRDEGYSDVVKELFVRILDLRSDRGDFLQVRFWLYLKGLTVRAYRKQFKQLELERDSFQLTSLEDYDDEDTDALARKGGMRAPSTFTTRTVESEVIDKIMIRETLSQLEEPLQSAYLLRHYWGWPIEDQDPCVQTISRHFNKTPRTIRNWLARAEKCLEPWREENRDEQTK